MFYALLMTALTMVSIICFIGAVHCFDEEEDN